MVDLSDGEFKYLDETLQTRVNGSQETFRSMPTFLPRVKPLEDMIEPDRTICIVDKSLVQKEEDNLEGQNGSLYDKNCLKMLR